MLVARPGRDEPAILVFGKPAEEFEVVRRWTVVGERRKLLKEGPSQISGSSSSESTGMKPCRKKVRNGLS
ncbi:hypothetical protein EKH55_3797 [Sinorhizobium alkalisoli]|nr:hypothetical protein EKH55_3797 [Sinorhizobium alkalisoli]